jgi:transcriptional regulator with XRE-family HTH domain
MSSDQQSLKNLGKSLKAQRKSRGLTQEELAELCDFDPTYISLLERGKRNPAFLTLVKIARNLGCRVADIVKNA